MKVRTLIVDDEPLARQRLRALLTTDADVALLGECGDGAEAVTELGRLRPDLVFLDVQMPVLDGFGVLQALGADWAPEVIFVTAHDHYALKAFEVHALDYLLKPFDKARFASALERAKARIRQGAGLDERVQALLQSVQPRSGPERLIVKSAGRIYFIRIDDVDWIEAAANYVRLHVGKEDHLLRESLTALEKRLDPARFARIHRSTIVNLERIRELQPVFHGDYVLILRDGTELAVSRNFRDKLRAALGATP
ncbi:MAG: LytTR family DNA-binding domain-containing protein [Gemmataceae bacterium]